MGRDDELWILLTDPHEVDEVDGAWAEGISRLAGSSETGPSVLTEPRIAACVEAVAPQARVHVSESNGPVRRLEELDRCHASLLDLLFLRGELPDPARWALIRSFGLRSAILGCVIASELKRSHIAFFADRLGEDVQPLRGYRLGQAVRYLEGLVVASSDRVETPDEASATHLEELFLPPSGKIVPMPFPAKDRNGSPAETGSTSIGVVADTQHWGKNRLLLDALARQRFDDDFRLNWLARRQGSASMRARQDLRSYGLARYLHWEEEPWVHPIHLREMPWDLLLFPAPGSGAQMLAIRFSAAGGTIVIPEGSAHFVRLPGALQVPWTVSHLAEVLETHAIGSRSDPTPEATKGGE